MKREEALLKKNPFLFLWLSQITSSLAFNMMNLLLIILIFELTSSNTAVSGLIVSFSLPALIFGMFSGAYVDRHDKRNVLVATNVVRALLVFLLIMSITVGKIHIALVYLLSFLLSSATQFFVPAEASSIPRVVEKKLLIFANSLFTMTLYGSIFVGYILAGPMLKALGFTQSLFASALLYLAASGFSYLLPPLAGVTHEAAGMKRVLVEVRRVYESMFQVRSIFFAVLLLTLSQVLVLILATILPGLATTVLRIQPSDISLFILTPLTLGMVLGSALLLTFGKRFSKDFLVTLSLIVSGILLSLLPYLPKLVVDNFFIALLLLLIGIFNAFIVIISNETLQSKTDQSLVGQMYGILLVLSAAFSLFPVLLSGILADLLGVSFVLTIIGIGTALLGVFTIAKDDAF